MSKFSDQVVYYRNLRGLTQEELAEKMNVKRNAVSQWENGKRFPKEHTINKLAEALNISPGVLLPDKDNFDNEFNEYNNKNYNESKEYNFSMMLLEKLVKEGKIKDRNDITPEIKRKVMNAWLADLDNYLDDEGANK